MTQSHQQRLDIAKKNKSDEFYTQLSDIEKELPFYKDQFQNQIIFCNCDDPYESYFFKYFATNFNFLGLKKLIATCYDGSPFAFKQITLFDICNLRPKPSDHKRPYKIEINEVEAPNLDGAVDLADVERLIKNKKNVLTLLKGNGDFRSPECVELLKSSNIIVTNPPFSLFREYVSQLFNYNKNFLIIGNINSVTYKEIFPLIMNNKLWMGQSIHSGDREFRVPDNYPLEAAGCRVDEEGRRYIRVKGVRWFTNLDVPRRHEKLTLPKRYTPTDYPRYDNYDAIEVSSVANIPYDYEGMMCVPITFLDKYNPDQFDILGITDRQNSSGLRTKKYTLHDSDKYNDLNARGVILTPNGYKAKYARVIIKHKGIPNKDTAP
ncbi:MAG: adenine-specific methyltransferase EcoRI family protein [Deltaproteobacteria bacterium]|jgi:hypothetical protein|nr:adenine-specific methyltransferase EcoRI family protein [Deltaproteobacteria bacterium]